MIRTLVGFDTVSRESNLGLIEFVRDHLARHGVRSRLTYDAGGGKANLFATVGEGRRPGIVLSGHTDVVPVDGQDWDTDPFTVHERDGRLYGRGTADMKSFIATALHYVPRFLAADMSGAVHLALSYDEEIGAFGVPLLLKDLEEAGIRPAGCIVGEPTSMEPVLAHKGTHRFRCCVRGREAHSAMATLGVNSIEVAARLIVYIRHLAERYGQLETRDYGFPVPFTTLQTTMISGGTGQNIVPRDCEFLVDVRTLPGGSFDAIYDEVRRYAATLEPAMKAVAPEAGIGFEFLFTMPGFEVGDQDKVVQLASHLARNSRFGKVSFGTEAGLFGQAGIPTVVIGPGDIAQAHTPNEFITLEQVVLAERFVERLIEHDAVLERAAAEAPRA
ncbi:MAG: acetylornithine deacetylase [Burkholderiales bacterium]|nr:MAG: acetylornithine deacetylase [Burkholderiales bacterium]